MIPLTLGGKKLRAQRTFLVRIRKRTIKKVDIFSQLRVKH